MCDIGIALTLASTAIAGVGLIQQGQATAAAQRSNAQIAEMNATLSERRAKDALERGKDAEQQKRLEVAQLKGRQLAAMAANGVDVTFGSPLDTLEDTATLGELDALTIRRNAAREAYDYQVDAVNGRYDASLDRSSADSALTSGYLNAAGTVLGGLSTSYKDYRDYTRPAVGQASAGLN